MLFCTLLSVVDCCLRTLFLRFCLCIVVDVMLILWRLRRCRMGDFRSSVGVRLLLGRVGCGFGRRGTEVIIVVTQKCAKRVLNALKTPLERPKTPQKHLFRFFIQNTHFYPNQAPFSTISNPKNDFSPYFFQFQNHRINNTPFKSFPVSPRPRKCTRQKTKCFTGACWRFEHRIPLFVEC